MKRQEHNENLHGLGNLIYFRAHEIPLSGLTPGQTHVLRLLVNGKSISEIASQLNLNERTVATYSEKLMATVGSQLVKGDSVKEEAQSPPNNDNASPERLDHQPRPPINAEYVLYLLFRKDEREVAIGDLIEEYDQVLRRFDRRRADIWFYKQVAGSLFPLLRRAVVRIGALVWLGRVLRRLIS